MTTWEEHWSKLLAVGRIGSRVKRQTVHGGNRTGPGAGEHARRDTRLLPRTPRHRRQVTRGPAPNDHTSVQYKLYVDPSPPSPSWQLLKDPAPSNTRPTGRMFRRAPTRLRQTEPESHRIHSASLERLPAASSTTRSVMAHWQATSIALFPTLPPWLLPPEFVNRRMPLPTLSCCTVA